MGLIFGMFFPGQSQDCVIDLTTGTGPVGSTDLIWEVRIPGSGIFVPVTISTGALQNSSGTIYPNAYAQDRCGRWISPHLTSGFNITNTGGLSGIYTYQAVITVDAPCGIDSAEMCFDFMAADNVLSAVRVNGDNYPPPPGITHIAPGNMCAFVSLVPGINVIQVDVNNFESYTGLQLCGELSVYKTSCDPPEDLHCCEAPAGQVLTWAEVEGAIGYNIEFGFNSECCENSTELPTGWMEFVTDNVFLVPESFGDCFWWRVRAVYPDGSTTEWSEKECDCIDVELPCETPTDLSCAYNSVGRILSWGTVADAVSYDVAISYDDPSCCPPVDDLPFSTIFFTTDIFHVEPGPNKCFSWRVRAHCQNGGVSDWSEPKCSNDCSFSISDSPSSEDVENRTSLGSDKITTRIIPNPANEFVTITIDDATNIRKGSEATLMILDITGKEIYNASIRLNEPKQIDVSLFSSGIYYLKVLEDGKVIASDKLAIQ